MDSKLALSIACAETEKGRAAIAPLLQARALDEIVLLWVRVDRPEPPVRVVSSDAMLLSAMTLRTVTPEADSLLGAVARVVQAGQLPLVACLNYGSRVDLLVLGFGEVARA